jgi:cytochrome c biogenesis protein CcmG/thiol:disulfide interchange protein DsbE
MSTPETPENASPQSSILVFILPALLFVVLAIVFVAALVEGNHSILPSALIDKPVPEFTLPPLKGVTREGKPVPGFSTADLATGEVTVLTVWASNCFVCAQEQPTLMAFKAERDIRLYSINYKDKPDAARAFLARYGNPFDTIGADLSGRVSIDWGVYGTPETFVVDGQGVIRYKYVGALHKKALEDELLPAIEKAQKTSQPKAG